MPAISRLSLFLVLICIVLLMSGGALAANVRGLDIHFTDIYSREVLYHYLQNDYITALSVPAAVQDGTTSDRLLTNTDLLLAQAYLAYGLHNNVDELFRRTIDNNISPRLLARTQLDLAWVYYHRGNYRRAEEILTQVGDSVAGDLKEERQVLLGDVLQAQGRVERAVQAWGMLTGESDWTYYGRYNRAIALQTLKRVDEARSALEQLALVSGASDEITALRDKANLALGNTYLEEKSFDRAQTYFERIPAGSPYYREALLNLGWCKSLSRQQQAALVPWQKLQAGDVTDPQVQQALIAVPYALAKLGNDAESLERNQDAISVFSAQLEAIDAAIISLNEGPLLDQLLSLKPDPKSGGVKLTTSFLAARGASYLVDLLARNEFQAAYSSYRDLRVLRRSLTGWNTDIKSYSRVLQTRSKFAALSKQLDVSRDRISQLLVEVDSLTDIHKNYIRDLAITSLNQDKERLKQYLGYVRLAAAQIYDVRFVKQEGRRP